MPTPSPKHDICQQCWMECICQHASQTEAPACKPNPVLKHTSELKCRELLYSYHDPLKSIYVIKAGAIKSFQIDLNGQERILNFYLPGEVIGLEAIQTGFYPYSAIALSKTLVCEIPYESLLDYIADYRELQRHIVKVLGFRINQGQYIINHHAEQSLAAFILDIAARLHQEQVTLAFELPMSRYDIGNYLGLAPETVSRLFTRFQSAGLLQVQNKKIKIISADKLRWVSQEGLAS